METDKKENKMFVEMNKLSLPRVEDGDWVQWFGMRLV